MLLNELSKAIVNLVPHFMRRDGAQFAARHFDGDVHGALVADLHDHRIGAAAARKEMRD